ncbi:MAG: TrkH family potassium uptake protein [Firmicutes bacterium]|nr:TrkH family potassium uptake protein [Bacillota bacterium]
MDFGIVLKTLGRLLIVEASFLILPLLVSIYYQESDTMAFLITIIITVLVGLLLNIIKAKKGIVRYREGFLIVGMGWLLVSLFGAIPFSLAGTFNTFIDSFFETVSGFTTTGATVLANIESQPHGILFWRGLTHWLGGMGILVFTLALLPAMGLSNVNILKAESPGPTPGKLVPKIAKTAQLLYYIYIIFTVVEIIALKIAGMSYFDAITHTFATMGTGGFSPKNLSVGAYNMPSYEWIIFLFMFLAGANFSLYYDALIGKFKTLFKDREFQFYTLVIFVSIILITLNITNSWESLSLSFRQASFQVASIVSTTGFTTLDYSIWPAFSKMVLFVLMFFGGSAGSTGGAIKHIRILIVFKYIKREFQKLIHPNSVATIRVGNQPIPEGVVQNVIAFVLIYMLIFVSFSLVLLTQEMDILSSTSAVAATLGNVGPGFGMVGPAMNYGGLTSFTKILLSLAMILGRLEIYTVLILFTPLFWRN